MAPLVPQGEAPLVTASFPELTAAAALLEREGATPGLCRCGCGERTNLAQRTDPARGWIKGQPLRFVLGHVARTQKRSANWKGGRTKLVGGYVGLYMPTHPRAHNRYVREHILVVEKAMGKPLRRSAQVHHVDNNGENNANTNLVACDSIAYHKLLHQRQRALDACGNPNALPCMICGSYERQDEMALGKSFCGGRRGYHRDCRNALRRRKRAEHCGRPAP